MSLFPDLSRVAIIGAGRAGVEFTLRCVAAGFEVTLEDVMPSRLRHAQDAFAASGNRSGPGTLRLASTVEEAVRQADIAIDFVPDELESKLEIFSMLDRMAPPATILCTPTATQSIADLASCTYRPQLCLGLRLPSRLEKGSEAELIRTSRTSPQALQATTEWLQRAEFAVTVIHDPFEAPGQISGQPGVTSSER